MKPLLFFISALAVAQTTISQPYQGLQSGIYGVQVSALGVIALSTTIPTPSNCTAPTQAPWVYTCTPSAPTINYTTNGTIKLTLAATQPSLGAWKPSAQCFAGDTLLDSNGNIEQTFSTGTVTAAALGTSGTTTPAWPTALWGFVNDGTCTKQMIGRPTQVWCMGAGPLGPSSIPAVAFIPFWVQESYTVTTFQTVGGVTTVQSTYGPYPRAGFVDSSLTPSGNAFAWTKTDTTCSGSPSLTFVSTPGFGEQRLGVMLTGRW